MAVNQRELERGINRQIFQWDEFSSIGTGTTLLCTIIPYNSAIDTVLASAMGLSNTPVSSLYAYRGVTSGQGNNATFLGFTQVGLGCTISWVNVGTSGVVGGTLIGGSALVGGGITLLVGDVIVMATTGTNAALGGAILQLIVRGLEDTRNYQSLALGA